MPSLRYIPGSNRICKSFVGRMGYRKTGWCLDGTGSDRMDGICFSGDDSFRYHDVFSNSFRKYCCPWLWGADKSGIQKLFPGLFRLYRTAACYLLSTYTRIGKWHFCNHRSSKIRREIRSYRRGIDSCCLQVIGSLRQGIRRSQSIQTGCKAAGGYYRLVQQWSFCHWLFHGSKIYSRRIWNLYGKRRHYAGL